MDTFSSHMVAALEDAWLEIRRAHPDVPPAVVVIGTGSTPGGKFLRYGQWAPYRWQDGKPVRASRAKKKAPKTKAPGVSEVLIGGEGLRRGGVETMGTLLHEAAHALATARGIQDTSREGRYHNKKFVALATELGLVTEEQGTRGWASTTIPGPTAKRWRKVVQALDKAIAKSFRLGEPTGAKKKAGSRMLKAECECETPRKIRIALAVFEVADITCGECCEPFSLSEE